MKTQIIKIIMFLLRMRQCEVCERWLNREGVLISTDQNRTRKICRTCLSEEADQIKAEASYEEERPHEKRDFTL